MHVEETLISPVETDTSLCQSIEGIIVGHVGVQDQNSAVKTVGPADVRNCGEICVESQQLVWSSQSDGVCIQIDYPLELCLTP